MSMDLSYVVEPRGSQISVGVEPHGEGGFTQPDDLIWLSQIEAGVGDDGPGETRRHYFTVSDDPNTVYQQYGLDWDVEWGEDDGTLTVRVTDTNSNVIQSSVETFSMAELGYEELPPPPDPSEVRNDIERDIMDRTGGKTLWRVGVPRISDTWIDSFSSGRGSGGLGTGIYAYVTREGAQKDNSAVGSPNLRDPRRIQPVQALVGALQNPLVVSTGSERSMFELNDASRVMSAIGQRARRDDTSGVIDGLRREYRRGRVVDPEWLPKSLSLRGAAMTLSRLVGGQARETFTPRDVDEMGLAMLDAVEEAAAQQQVVREDGRRGGLLQPINYLLYPTFDGIYPTADSGGDTNKWGAVVFSQKVHRCTDRRLIGDEEVDPDELNDCFERLA